MGNYDLGAAVSRSGFRRDIRMVRAPEADGQAAQHLDESLERAGAGAVKVAYNTSNMALPLSSSMPSAQGRDCFAIQGDRAVANVSQREARPLRRNRQAAGRSLHARLRCTGADLSALHRAAHSFHRYKIIAREPILCVRTDRDRTSAIEEAMQAWSRTSGERNRRALVAMVFVGPDFFRSDER